MKKQLAFDNKTINFLDDFFNIKTFFFFSLSYSILLQINKKTNKFKSASKVNSKATLRKGQEKVSFRRIILWVAIDSKTKKTN